MISGENIFVTQYGSNEGYKIVISRRYSMPQLTEEELATLHLVMTEILENRKPNLLYADIETIIDMTE